MNRRIVLLLLLLITLAFRILQLDADPPSDFSWSGGYFADEGFWSHNARNAALFGNPVQDEWDARIVSPIFARLQQWIFQSFGAGFVQVRLIAVLSSLLLAAACFLLFQKQFDLQRSFLLSILILLNYPMMVLGRQGILDPFAATLAWLALLLVLRGSSLSLFCAGIIFVMACVTKYLMIYTAIPFLLLLWRSPKILPFLGGVAAAALPWLFLNYLPHKDLMSAYSAYYASQQGWQISSVMRNIVQQPFFLYFVKTPAILCLANLALWFFLLRYKTLSSLERVCFVWLLSGIIFFAIWRYRPFRYYSSLIPVVATMAGFALFRLEEIGCALREGKFRLLLFLGMLLPVIQIGFLLIDRFTGWNLIPSQLGIHTADAVLLVVYSFFVLFGLRANKRTWVAWGFIFIFLFSDFRNYCVWMMKPEYNAVAISNDLEREAPQGIVTGQWAPELCLGNHLRAIPVWRGFVNSQDPFQKYGITHVLQWKYPLGGEKFEEWYPAQFGNFELIKTYRIKDSDLLLYKRKKLNE